MSETTRYYRLLKIQPGATQAEIKAAYRRQAKQWHPDRFPGDIQKQQQAEEQIKAINIAYTYLRENRGKGWTAETPQKSQQNSGTTPSVVRPKYSTTSTQVESYYQKATHLAETKQYQAAADILSMAIRLRPTYVEAYHLRMLMFSALGFKNRARSDQEHIRRIEVETGASFQRASDMRSQQTYQAEQTTQAKTSAWNYVQTLNGHQAAITGVVIAQKGKVLVSSDQEGYVYLWNITKGKRFGSLGSHKGRVHSIAISSDDQLVATGGSHGLVNLWHVSTGSLIRSLQGAGASIQSIAFSPNRKMIVGGDEQGLVYFWDLQRGILLKKLSAHKAAVKAIASNPNGLDIASSDAIDSIKIWNIHSRKFLGPIETSIQDVLALTFSPNRRDILLGRMNGVIQQFNLESFQVSRQFIGHQQAVNALAIRSDGRLFASGSEDCTVRIWSTDGGKALLTEHDAPVNTVAFSSNGKLLASGSNDCTIRIWQHDCSPQRDR